MSVSSARRMLAAEDGEEVAACCGGGRRGPGLRGKDREQTGVFWIKKRDAEMRESGYGKGLRMNGVGGGLGRDEKVGCLRGEQ